MTPKIHDVLFYCAGNTCRSPCAEYLAKELKNKKFKEELKEINFDSAGLFHYYETPRPGTIKFLESKGIDISDFRAKKIDAELLEKQDLILGFEQKRHVDKIKRKFKSIKNLDKKVFLFLEFAGETEKLDIEDPFDLEQEEYKKTLEIIEDGVKKIIEKIIKINKSEENENEKD